MFLLKCSLHSQLYIEPNGLIHCLLCLFNLSWGQAEQGRDQNSTGNLDITNGILPILHSNLEPETEILEFSTK